MFTRIKAQSLRFRCFSLMLLLFVPVTVILARWYAPARVSARDADAVLLQAQRPAAQLETEIVTITPIGFEPGEITRPQGRFLLAVDNRSGLSEVQLFLEAETGARLNSAPTRKGKLAWRDVIDFPPGTYILRAVNDDSWRCRITLTPR